MTQANARLGIGMAALGRPGYINLGHADDLSRDYDEAAMERHAHAVLDAAFEAGIRYFDAARSYGRSEKFLASWISSRKFDPGQLEVGSKWGYVYTADWQVQTPAGVAHEVKEHNVEVLRRQYALSRKLLGDWLSRYQIHSATLDSGVLENDDVINELNQMRQSGLQIGLSVSGPGQPATIDRALEIRFDGQRLFSSVQATWNVLEPSAGPALQRARDAGLSTIVKESLANGRLTTRNTDSGDAVLIAELTRLANEQSTTVDAIAISAAVNQPWADIVLSGAATVSHVRSNAAAMNVDGSNQLSKQLASFAQPPSEYWNRRSQLAWN